MSLPWFLIIPVGLCSVDGWLPGRLLIIRPRSGPHFGSILGKYKCLSLIHLVARLCVGEKSTLNCRTSYAPQALWAFVSFSEEWKCQHLLPSSITVRAAWKTPWPQVMDAQYLVIWFRIFSSKNACIRLHVGLKNQGSYWIGASHVCILYYYTPPKAASHT